MTGQHWENKIPERFIPEVGSKIEHLTVLSKLGEGSFGSVFKVRNSHDSNIVALKLLNLWTIPYPEERQKILERFKLEYETGQIDNRYLVHTRGYGEISGNPFILMDFCSNGDLRKNMLRYRSLDNINRIAKEILLGLKALHENGKVHRDLKPDNILFTGDQSVRLTDFGIAGHKNVRMTKRNIFGKPDEILGTYAYMPPEQIKPPNHHVTILPTTDIFSFGVLIFEMFCGKLPFGLLEETFHIPEYVRRVNIGEWDDIKGYRQDVPGYWVEIIERCINPRYKQRFQSVDEILEMLGETSFKLRKLTIDAGFACTLQIMQGEEYGRVYPVYKLKPNSADTLFSIGRKDPSVQNDIEIVERNTAYISRFQATLEKWSSPSGWCLKDGQWDHKNRQWKPSKNGTFVNSHKLGEQGIILRHNDIITIGDTTLKIISGI